MRLCQALDVEAVEVIADMKRRMATLEKSKP
jgi:hypothetical protein